MSAIVGQLIDCPNLQFKLDEQFVNFDASNTQDAVGYLMFLMSPLNNDGFFQRQLAPGNGKLRKVELVYEQRLNEDQVTDSAIQSCSGGDETGQCVTEYDIDEDDGKSTEWTITTANLIRNCELNPSYFARQIQKRMDVLIREIDKDILADAALNFGFFSTSSFDHSTSATSAWAGSVGPGLLPTRKSGSGDFDPRFITQFRSEFQNMNFSGTPFAIGDNTLDAFFTEFDASCCADSGMNLGELAAIKPIVYLRDEFVSDALGDINEFIGMVAGATQLLTFLEFEGESNIFMDDQYIQMTLRDPRTGLVFDYLTKFDCGKWFNQLKLAFKTAYLPTDLADGDDKLNNVNWLNNFKVVNP